jgi:hypothetical protein
MQKNSIYCKHFSRLYYTVPHSLLALCILLNAFVIVALIRNRRRVLVNVFYVLVLHCAIVDLIRGGCLIAWGMRKRYTIINLEGGKVMNLTSLFCASFGQMPFGKTHCRRYFPHPIKWSEM